MSEFFYQEIVIHCLNDKKYNIRVYKYNITCYYVDHTGNIFESSYWSKITLINPIR